MNTNQIEYIQRVKIADDSDLERRQSSISAEMIVFCDKWLLASGFWLYEVGMDPN